MFEVQLKNYEKVQEAWEMSDEEKVNQATISKEKGTKRFKEQQFKIACTHYERVIELLKHQEAKVEICVFGCLFSCKMRFLLLIQFQNALLVPY